MAKDGLKMGCENVKLFLSEPFAGEGMVRGYSDGKSGDQRDGEQESH